VSEYVAIGPMVLVLVLALVLNLVVLLTSLDILAGFLGHNIRVHRNFYRLPVSDSNCAWHFLLSAAMYWFSFWMSLVSGIICGLFILLKVRVDIRFM